MSHSAWTPKAGLEVQLPRDLFAYVSATRGFKSGGFNPSSTAAGRGYAPEWAWNYEGGLKGALRNGRSRFAVSLFHMDYTDLQVQTPVGIGVFDIRNAAAATIRGVEVENTSRLGFGVEGGGHLAWLDAKYDRYIAVSNSGEIGVRPPGRPCRVRAQPSPLGARRVCQERERCRLHHGHVRHRADRVRRTSGTVASVLRGLHGTAMTA
jgi:iron complex outermembrane receptor protein